MLFWDLFCFWNKQNSIPFILLLIAEYGFEQNCILLGTLKDA